MARKIKTKNLENTRLVDGPIARHVVKILDICVMPHMTEWNFNMSVIVEVMAIY